MDLLVPLGPTAQLRVRIGRVFLQLRVRRGPAGDFQANSVGALIIFVLLYFLLATGTVLRENIIFALPTLRDKRRALTVTSNVQRSVSAYLITVILINLGLGAAIGFAMYAIGLPNPALWGAMAAMLNFIPYLGAIAGSIVVAIVGLVTYATPVEALLPPMIYLAINSLEGYLATPAILSRRLTINPIAVFLSIVFWGWIWGVAGALMAVPILACLKVICDATERLAPVSQFLSGRRAE
jgi:predicted PurR-regulated permease PerM